MKKIAIVGTAPSTRAQAPFDDPEWQIWALSWRYYDLETTREPKADLLFEVHDPKVHGHKWQKLYWEFLRNPPAPILMRPEVAGVATGEILDLDALSAIGRDYFTSSIAYMIAEAIHQGATHIGLWGIDLSDDTEYVDQRPCAEYWLGIAQARGIEIYVPEQSAIFSAPTYGIDDGGPDEMVEWIKGFAERVGDKKEQLRDQYHEAVGAEMAAQKLIRLGRYKDRGIDISALK